MVKEISEKLAKLLGKDWRTKKICVAISGGRDSALLLHILLEAGATLCAVNIEHGIRGEESLRDTLFVKDLCARLGVELFAATVNAPAFAKENGYTLEQGARILRYQEFEKILKNGKADYIALAHHADDQVETVLMRILRGTGLRGLCGMKELSGKYIRPLLGVSREQIDEYVKEHKIVYVEDSTNLDETYTRNFLREEISRLKTRYPNLSKSVERLCASAVEAEDYLNAQTPEIEVKDAQSYIKTADCANTLIAKRLFLKAADAVGVRQDIEEKHLNLLLDFVSAESGKYLMLQHGLCAYKEGEYIVFALKESEQNIGEVPLEIGCFDGVQVELVSGDEARELAGKDGALYMDVDKVPKGAIIRRRQDGDYIHKFGGGTKSLGDYFTDKKVPLRKRDGIAVIADGNRILAAVGVDISADVKVDENTAFAYRVTSI